MTNKILFLMTFIVVQLFFVPKVQSECHPVWGKINAEEWVSYSQWKMYAENETFDCPFWRKLEGIYSGRVLERHGDVTIHRRESFFSPRKQSEVFLGDTFAVGQGSILHMLIAGKWQLTVRGPAEVALLGFHQKNLYLWHRLGILEFNTFRGSEGAVVFFHPSGHHIERALHGKAEVLEKTKEFSLDEQWSPQQSLIPKELQEIRYWKNYPSMTEQLVEKNEESQLSNWIRIWDERVKKQ